MRRVNVARWRSCRAKAGRSTYCNPFVLKLFVFEEPGLLQSFFPELPTYFCVVVQAKGFFQTRANLAWPLHFSLVVSGVHSLHQLHTTVLGHANGHGYLFLVEKGP